MLCVSDVFHSGHSHHPQCCVIKHCAAGDGRRSVAAGKRGQSQQSPEIPQCQRIFCPSPLVAPAFTIFAITFLIKGGSLYHCRSGKMLDSQKGACSVIRWSL